MAISVVPVIYDSLTKQVLRWYLLDFESQLADPAFRPASPNESYISIPMDIYRTFGTSQQGFPSVDDLQEYVVRNAP